MLARLNPFRGLSNARDIASWGMFELANHSFALLVNTMLFPLYFREIVVGDAHRGDSLWGITDGASAAIIVLLSPVLGAIADARGIKKKMLLVTGLLCVVFTLSLGLVGPGSVVLAILLFVPGNVMFHLGENLLAGFLPELATQKNLGRISALGWTMGYVGALGSLICAGALMFLFGWTETAHWRPLFVFAGIWFLVMAIPTALFLPERARGDPSARGLALVTLGFRRLAGTVRDARRYRQLLGFLGVFFLYMTVVNMMVYFAVIIAKDYGFHSTKLVLFTMQITITTAIGAFLTGRFQDRLGHKRTVMIYVFAWLLTCVGMAFVPEHAAALEGVSAPDSVEPAAAAWPVWLLGNALGLSLGGVGTSSRSVIAAFTPRHKSAEFFGLWGLTAKSAAAVGLPVFALIKAGLGNQVLFIVMSCVCLVALGLLTLVNQRAGEAAARSAEEREGVSFPPM